MNDKQKERMEEAINEITEEVYYDIEDMIIAPDRDQIGVLNSIYNTIEYGISSAFKRARRFKIEEKTTQSKRRK